MSQLSSKVRRAVILRPATRVDVSQIEPWYGEASVAVRGGEFDAEDTFARRFEQADGRLQVIGEGDEAIGLIEYLVHGPAEGWLSTTFIALKDGRRGFGYGAEAVRAMEEWAEKSHMVTSFLAEISPRNGLALYFWLRVGYRPAKAGEVFWRAPDKGGIIAMIRA